jgi:subtilisin family serine protease
MSKKGIVWFGIFFLLVFKNTGAVGIESGKLNTDVPYTANRVVLKIADFDGKQAAGAHATNVPGDRSQSLHPMELLTLKYPAVVKKTRIHQNTGYWIIETAVGADIEALCRQFKQEPMVVDASPDYIASISRTAPDDAYFRYQYALSNSGQVYRPGLGYTGTAGSDIKALEGWDWSVGGDDVIIAIVDSGVALDHEDLVNKIVPGYNFVELDTEPYDDNGHGTFVASIAAAETNNGVGIAGVSWNAKIMPIKVVNSQGLASYLAIAEGIRKAAEQGAQVINLSIGGVSPSFILEDACEYAYNLGAVLVAATGNTGSAVLYPAAYDDYCIAVGATDANDEVPDFSNYGPQVDVTAPGVEVVGAYFSPRTSYATPHVSGAAALLLSYKPFLTNTQVVTLIKITADDINATAYPGVDDFTGYGRINLQTLLGPYSLRD